MTVQYASDLHLEFPQNKAYLKAMPLLPCAEVLVLAGDIVPFTQIDKHKDFFSYIADNFKTTYWLPGNHEYYYFDAATKSGTIHEKIKSNFFLVNDIAIEEDNCKLIFSTLWSYISQENQWAIERSMSDFEVIKYNGYRLSADGFNYMHKQSLAFIMAELQKPTVGKTLVATHHVPTRMHYPSQYKTSVLNEAFAIELFDTIEASNIDYWIYGHHHVNTPTFSIGNTQMLTNQLGYIQNNEHGLFELNKVIKI
jgi:predicted phosphohydrolase